MSTTKKVIIVVGAVAALANFVHDWNKYGFLQSTGWMTATILLAGHCLSIFTKD